MRRLCSSLVSSEERSTAYNLPCRFFASGLYRRIVCHLGDDAPCTSLRTAFNAAMTTLFHFPPLVLLPFRCGGLCAAHSPPPKGMLCVPDSEPTLPFCLLLEPASKSSLRFLANGPSPILLFLPPDPHRPPHFVRNLLLRPQNAIF